MMNYANYLNSDNDNYEKYLLKSRNKIIPVISKFNK